MRSVRTSSQRLDLFPTTVMTFEHDASALNEALASHFLSEARYWREDQAQQSDSFNLMDLAPRLQSLSVLQSLFESALREYCRALGWGGDYELSMQMFPNISPARHYVPSHNHTAHVAAVYYVQTASFDDRPIISVEDEISDYWRPEEGVLILHDPRFNASLMGAWQHFARVYPRPGLLLMFPAFLWHQVTPHFSDEPRLSVAANFTLMPKGAVTLEHKADFSV